MKQFLTCEWAEYRMTEMNASKSLMYEAVSNGSINHCQPLSEMGCGAEISRESVITIGSVLVRDTHYRSHHTCWTGSIYICRRKNGSKLAQYSLCIVLKPVLSTSL